MTKNHIHEIKDKNSHTLNKHKFKMKLIMNLKAKETMLRKYVILSYSNFDCLKHITLKIFLCKINFFAFHFTFLYNEDGNEGNELQWMEIMEMNFSEFWKKKERKKTRKDILQITILN